MKVISISKSVNPSSMHWNDLYSTLRVKYPGRSFPTLAIRLGWGRVKFRSEDCAGRRRLYLQAGFPQAVFFLRQLSRRYKAPLVIHVHTPVLAFAVLSARLLGGRFHVVTTQHNTWSGFRPHQKFCLWIASLLSDAYVGCGRQATETIPVGMKTRLRRRLRLFSIPNGIPSDILGKIAERRHVKMTGRDDGSDTKTLIVAKMAPQKNCMHLLELIAEIPELGKVTWYGAGKMHSRLLAERKRLGLEARVEFAGIVSRDRIYEALTEHDFYLTASLWEGLSVADLEAVAIGCLPLMSDIPERREIAAETGIDLLPQGGVEVWRAEVQRFAAMPFAERAAYGLALSERACRAFSLERMTESYMKTYERAALAASAE